MKFTLVSDLHLDFPQRRIPIEDFEENVVIAGDTANSLKALRFFEKLRSRGHNVFAVDGNHEHYSNKLGDHTKVVKHFPQTGMMGDIPIVLVNGWYNISDEYHWLSYMNDKESKLSAKEISDLAYQDYLVVLKELERWREEGLKGIVVTHTAPCEESLDPAYANERSNEYYFNPYMRNLFHFPIHYWCHGHTHARFSGEVDGVKIECNPRGYPHENPDWKPVTCGT